MKIKIGNDWFVPSPGQPIMIQLDEGDKKQFFNSMIDKTFHRIAFFDDSDIRSLKEEQIKNWMDDKVRIVLERVVEDVEPEENDADDDPDETLPGTDATENEPPTIEL